MSHSSLCRSRNCRILDCVVLGCVVLDCVVLGIVVLDPVGVSRIERPVQYGIRESMVILIYEFYLVLQMMKKEQIKEYHNAMQLIYTKRKEKVTSFSIGFLLC